MGCGSSVGGSVEQLTHEQLEEFAQSAKVDATRVKYYHKQFAKADKDGSGQINIEEFCDAIEMEKTDYVLSLFNKLDRDGGGQIDFREFLVGLAQFVKDDDPEMNLKFAFELFDMNKDGMVSKDELSKMMLAFRLAGEKHVKDKVNGIFAKVDKDHNDVLTYDEFKDFAKKYPSYLFPAYSMWLNTIVNMGGEQI